MSFSWKRFLQIGKIIFPFVVLTIVFFQAKKELAGISFLEAINTIKNIPTGGVFFSNYTWCICRINNVLLRLCYASLFKS